MSTDSFFNSDAFIFIISIFTFVWGVFLLRCILDYNAIIGDPVASVAALLGIFAFLAHVIILIMKYKEILN